MEKKNGPLDRTKQVGTASGPSGEAQRPSKVDRGVGGPDELRSAGGEGASPLLRKKRLKMLPEVLPAPPKENPQGSPRQRTLRTMERLVAAAAATALVASCSSNVGVTTGGSGGGGSSGTSGSNGNGSGGSGGGGVTTGGGGVVGDGAGGYIAVDPLPPPSRCMGVAATIAAKATWKQDAGQLVVELQLTHPTQPDASFATETPSVSGAEVLTVNAGTDLTMLLKPGSGVVRVYIYVGVTCTEGPAHVSVTLDLAPSAPPKAGDAVKVTLEDAY